MTDATTTHDSKHGDHGSSCSHDHQAAPSCCGSDTGAMCGDIGPIGDVSAPGRSFQVSGLDCAEEVAILNRVLGPELGGTDHLAFDVINGRMTVLDGSGPMTDARLVELVATTGMQASPWTDKGAAQSQSEHLRKLGRLTALSAGFWGGGLLWHVVESGPAGALRIFAGHGDVAMPWAEVALFAGAILFGIWQVAPKAWSSARRVSPDMNLLMVVAVTGAVVLGEYFEAATVSFFFALSLYLESWSVGRARNAVAKLLDLAPPSARLIAEDGSESDVLAAQVAVGSRFVLRGGDRVPLDGVVVDGIGAADQAPITGESALVPKEPGDEIYAGSINGEGTLIVRATKPASQTVLARIIRMVSDAHSKRADVEQWVTKFARIYTPLVMVLALIIAIVPPLLLGGSWEAWIYNALVLLVIACPCALVISTPVSIVAALASAARAGVLIKGGAYVEAPARITSLALDKTGTLTEGAPEVAAVFALNGATTKQVLEVAATLEARSSHPIAGAILTRASDEGITAGSLDQSRTVPGRGVEGMFEGRKVWLGSDRFMTEELGSEPDFGGHREKIEEAGNTMVAIGAGQQMIGVLEIRDRIRPDARDVISRLHAIGISRIVMLTGDNARTAAAVARKVGIDEVRAELLPEDKVAAIEALVESGEQVAMVGDGVNDAPAMARAHLGIAMGAIGSDAAVETADIALMTDDIARLPWLINHSRRTMNVIRQNIGFSLVIKALFVALTAMGLATMWGAIAADVGVSLLVVANALRLLRGREDPLSQVINRDMYQEADKSPSAGAVPQSR